MSLKNKEKVIFIFRRDLRVEVNTALQKCLDYCQRNKFAMWPIFIFNPRQIVEHQNPYFSNYAAYFMINALENLKSYVHSLTFLYGIDEDIIVEINKNADIDSIWFNADYTPFARKRDDSIRTLAKHLSIKVKSYEDYTLKPIGSILNSSCSAYKVFTPFNVKFSIFVKKNPLKLLNKHKKITSPNLYQHLSTLTLPLPKKFVINDIHKFYNKNNIKEKYIATRQKALEILQNQAKLNYDRNRNNLAPNGTTRLGPYLKFGLISVREAFLKIQNEAFRRQLVWKEFFSNLTFAFPETLQGQVSNKPNQDLTGIKKKSWSENKKNLENWKHANTDEDFVNAGMNQLIETGYMHNRLRMVTASYLFNNLNIDWREGEKFFARNLVDYDPSNNNQNWQYMFRRNNYRPLKVNSQWKKYDPKKIYTYMYNKEINESKIRAKRIHNEPKKHLG